MEGGKVRHNPLYAPQEGLEFGGNATNNVAVSADPPASKVVNDMEGEEKSSGYVLAFWRLFQCADGIDILLMIFGTLGAMVNGLTLPAMLIIQGRLINTFGNLQDSPELIYDSIKKGVANWNLLKAEC